VLWLVGLLASALVLQQLAYRRRLAPVVAPLAGAAVPLDHSLPPRTQTYEALLYEARTTIDDVASPVAGSQVLGARIALPRLIEVTARIEQATTPADATGSHDLLSLALRRLQDDLRGVQDGRLSSLEAGRGLADLDAAFRELARLGIRPRL
jgi:hypothetical protein